MVDALNLITASMAPLPTALDWPLPSPLPPLAPTPPTALDLIDASIMWVLFTSGTSQVLIVDVLSVDVGKSVTF
jgi:hypothetical protein